MKSGKVEIWVGIFVALGIASVLMLALQVSGLSDFYREDNGYKVKAAFKNIGGLKVRSKVTVSGVTVGRVTNITLKQNKFGEYSAIVEMSINNKVSVLPKDSSAKVLTSGLLGDNYVGIEPGMDEDYLVQGDVIELTTQAVLLEDLISKFAIGGGNEK